MKNFAASGGKVAQAPKVSFVVPCYNLGHLLPECVNSILAQTCDAFEVLIMDDCSPDHTPDVAQSFQDTRIKYIRNKSNLGHLRNYNKGISLAAGEYVWLISADDRLRTPYILERYLEVMERCPEVGYAICPGLALEGDQETRVLKYSILGQQDKILNGREFLHILLKRNHVLAAAGMVRKRCYEEMGMFPLDLPFAGDWYLWCLFALHYDVAYFAEPMINYREHDHSMTNLLISEDVHILSQDDLAVRWRMKEKIEQVGYGSLVRRCKEVIIEDYAHSIISKVYKGVQCRMMSLEEFELSLVTHAKDSQERKEIRERVLTEVGDWLYLQQNFKKALDAYQLAIRQRGWNPKLWIKYGLLRLGRFGELVRHGVSYVRHMVRWQGCGSFRTTAK